MLERFEQEGLVARRKLPQSGRAFQISLTKRGRATLNVALKIAGDEHAQILALIGETDAMALMQIAAKLFDRLAALDEGQAT